MGTSLHVGVLWALDGRNLNCEDPGWVGSVCGNDLHCFDGLTWGCDRKHDSRCGQCGTDSAITDTCGGREPNKLKERRELYLGVGQAGGDSCMILFIRWRLSGSIK